MPIKFRAVGEEKWQAGVTANISRTGVFFHTQTMLRPNTVLEMRFAFPAEIMGRAAGQVICGGQIVRSQSASPENPQPALAVTIGTFRMLPSES
jgi:hypothetical protein